MEALVETSEVKKQKLSRKQTKMREISSLFNDSSSFSELRVKLDLAGIDLAAAEQKYTELVASNWPKFLDRFKDAKSEVFSFKKFMKLPIQRSLSTKTLRKPKLPWSIEKQVYTITVKYAVGAGDRVMTSAYRFESDAAKYGIDFEMEAMNTLLYESAF